MEKLSAYLENEGIRSSYQRLKILQYLQAHRTHPTVDMIYKNLSKEIPTLSKTTVYNTVKLFVSKGIVQELTIEEKEVRYDADTTQHAHFKCIECGSVYDVALESTIVLQGMVTEEGHKVIDCQVYLKGICKDCLKSTKN
ncbi:Fur family transcriptional regulator, peroxide stress response regulator [Methanophagales archaeon]|nr:Fur family transcriptional regulator, peroxide stress response regulator [Methanophagales archaeon]